VVAFFLLNFRNLIFSMKTVIYVLAGAIALSSVGCTAGRKERQAKAEPASGAKAVAKTKTSARAVLNSSSKPSDSKKAAVKEVVVAKSSTSASKPSQPVVKKDSKADLSGAAARNATAKVATKTGSKPEVKSSGRSSASADSGASGALSFNAPAVEAVAPLPRTSSSSNRVVVPPKLVRVSSLTESPEPVAPEKTSAPEKTAKVEKPEAPKSATVAKATPKASKEVVQAELNKALADAGSDAKAVVGSLVPTAIPDSPKGAEKPPVVEDDAPSTSDTSTVVKSPATMKSGDAGAPPAVVDSKGEVKEASSSATASSAAGSSKGGEPAAEAKSNAPEAVIPTSPTAPIEAPVAQAPKKPASPLEKKEMIASALRDGNEALKSEDSAKALELFESVVKQDKDQRDAWFRIGYLKEMSGDIQGAIKAFREVKRILAN
jgi:hypothetical protein